jgi:hypothetical protein
MLSAGRVQDLVRPVASHERCGCSHDIGVVPASPPAGAVNESDDDRDAPDLEPLDDLCV